MQTSLSTADLTDYVGRQMAAFFPDGAPLGGVLGTQVSRALERCDHCFSHTRVKYYCETGIAQFDHLNSDQYALFLYFLSRSAFESDSLAIAKKAYLLNKALHALDIFYEVRLPDILTFRHPVGTVLGRADYADYLCVYQNCTVGIGLDGERPRFDGAAVLFAGSKILGRCEIGDNCWVSAGTVAIGDNLAPESVIAGASPHLSVRPASRSVRAVFFGATG